MSYKNSFIKSTSYVKIFPEPPINRKEILRYAGVKEETEELARVIDECLIEAKGKLSYRVCFCEVSTKKDKNFVDFSFFKTCSKDLEKNLLGCHSAIIFAATVGIEIDRLIARYKRISPSKALIFQAIGTERIESLCDAFCAETAEQKKAEDKFVTARFSPGYGDFSIKAQEDIFACLECSKKIGVSLNASLLMSPSKSVTAIMGISEKCREKEHKKSCENCAKTNCTFRRLI